MFQNDAMILVLHFLASFHEYVIDNQSAFCSPSERQHKKIILTGLSRAGNCAVVICRVIWLRACQRTFPMPDEGT